MLGGGARADPLFEVSVTVQITQGSERIRFIGAVRIQLEDMGFVLKVFFQNMVADKLFIESVLFLRRPIWEVSTEKRIWLKNIYIYIYFISTIKI